MSCLILLAHSKSLFIMPLFLIFISFNSDIVFKNLGIYLKKFGNKR